jgi:hypothetical protein
MFELSVKAELLSNKTNINPQVILEIDGIDLVFGAITVTEYVRIGSEITIGDFIIGGTKDKENSRDLISLQGTSTRITNQILPDKGGVGSITRMSIKLVDKNKELSRIFSPGIVVPDILNRRASVFIAFKGGGHPEDSIPIFHGYIDDTDFGAGNVTLIIGSPDGRKRQEIYRKIEGRLTASMDASQTSMTVDNADGLIQPTDVIQCYVQVDNEIIKFTSASGTTISGLTRGQLGTIAASHSSAAKYKSFYRITDSPIDMALKTMLSNGGSAFATQVKATRFREVFPADIVEGAILFPAIDVRLKYGLVIGDKVSVTGSTSNNVIDAVITDFGENSLGSYIVTDAAIVTENSLTAVASFKSKYNVLPREAGMGMSPQDVDVDQHEHLKSILATALPTQDFYLKKSIKSKTFIEDEIYFTSGLFAVPRKGKSSVNTNLPPLVVNGVNVITSDHVVNPEDLKASRSIAKDFYNTIKVEYDEEALSEDTQEEFVRESSQSKERITDDERPLNIRARGLRAGASTTNALTVIAKRLLDRYQFAPESIKNVRTLFKTGFKLEVADSVIFGDPDLQITDTTQGNRKFAPRVMEIRNKELDLKGEVSFDFSDTAYGLSVRYGVVGPGSYMIAGSTASLLVLRKLWPDQIKKERKKWEPYIGQIIQVRSPDFTQVDETFFVGFDNSYDSAMKLDPPLSFVPSAEYIVEMPPYSGNKEEKDIWKAAHCFLGAQLTVVSGISQTQFTVSAPDAAKLFINSTIRVHNSSFSIDSDFLDPPVISDISGVTITTNQALGFIPAAGQLIDLIGFVSDEGKCYVYF